MNEYPGTKKEEGRILTPTSNHFASVESHFEIHFHWRFVVEYPPRSVLFSTIGRSNTFLCLSVDDGWDTKRKPVFFFQSYFSVRLPLLVG
jgi:hypothetical protein